MRSTFSLALLASVSLAGSLPDNNDEREFMGFAGTYNKHYKTTEQLADRIGIYLENKYIVQGLQTHSSDATFGLNETADLTTEEFLNMQGIEVPTDEEDLEGQSGHWTPSGESGMLGMAAPGRHLQTQYKDWRDTKFLGDVKSQGGCGSCWAFAATTVQETVQAIQDDAEPVRLSEQEGVDCDTRSHGCSGGWMHYYWQMSNQIGSSTNAAYEYEAEDGACRNQENKVIASKMKNWGWVGFTGDDDNVNRIATQLQSGPLSIAVSAGNECWRWYEGGILSEKDNCPTRIDHGVALVGLAQSDEGQDYWIIQNSWGSWWGDNGFVKLAVETGAGVTGMNWYVQHMSTDPDYPLSEEDQEEEGEDDSEPNPVPNCDHDEGQNPGGPHTCWHDDHCAGYRECSVWGWCHGGSFCDGTPVPEPCEIDESQNNRGPNRCWQDLECAGERTCSTWGWCHGAARC